VRLELAEAAEGLRKVSGPVRRHVRDCGECSDFRSQVRSNEKVMAALFPVGALVAFKSLIVSKLGFGGASGGASAGAAGGGAGATAAATSAGAGAVSSVGAALSGSGAAGGLGAVGGAIGAKAVAGVVTAAVLTAGAVEVNQNVNTTPAPTSSPPARISAAHHSPLSLSQSQAAAPQPKPQPVKEIVIPAPEPAAAPSGPAPSVTEIASDPDAAGQSSTTEIADETIVQAKTAMPNVTGAKSPTSTAGAPSGGETVVVTVGGSTPPPAPPAESSPAAETPPAESAPPVETPPAEPPAELPPPQEGSGEAG